MEQKIKKLQEQEIKELYDGECLIEAYLQATKDIKQTDKPYTIIPEYLTAL